MKRYKPILLIAFYIFVLAIIAEIIYETYTYDPQNGTSTELILGTQGYGDEGAAGIWNQLVHRVKMQPFNLIATILFACAIIHTFMTHAINLLLKKWLEQTPKENNDPMETVGIEALRFLGEVEVVFGIWVIPLLFAMTYFYDWETSVHYLDGLRYTEPVFVFVVMTLAATKPIVKLAEDCLAYIARISGDSVKTWWWAIMVIGPISGSFITEPGAMTISALLLGRHLYQLKPSKRFSYACLGLLFTNISVGGVLTNFAAPPVLMVAYKWGWSTTFMFAQFGIKAVVGILISNLTYFLVFRKEFGELDKRWKSRPKEQEKYDQEHPIPFGITLIHMTFLAYTVAHVHYPVIFLGAFLLFLGFYRATRPFQWSLELKTPILVAFFLAGLVVHGTLQAWWIGPVLMNTGEEPLMFLSMVLTAFNDNAEITFLASLIPNVSDSVKYAIMSGAIAGGGLTVIANAPNPSGQALLGKYFDGGISFGGLLLGALYPASVMILIFYLFRPM